MSPFKKEISSSNKTILVTDSGLGGYSVFARIASQLAKEPPGQNISLVYFNAWPEQNGGYNHFKTMDQRSKVFNAALNAMENFQPDRILIACNTLSIIYPFTPYSQNPASKIFGIVDHGVQLIHEYLMADPENHVILFGTPTTIAEKSHLKKLIKMGIDPSRITSQGCTNLAGKIEKNPFSSRVVEMINTNSAEAVSNIPESSKKKVGAALCCTHFGYCKDLFHQALSSQRKGKVTILNPNQRMADHVINDHKTDPQNKTKQNSPGMDMQVVSRVFWEPERIDAYARLLKNVSLKAVKALEAYEWNPDLFEV